MDIDVTLTPDPQAQAQAQSTFVIQKVFTENLSFEAPGTPLSFQGEWKPEANIDIQTKHQTLEKDLYQVMLTLTVTVKNQGKVAFLVEVKQSGLFSITGLDDKMDAVLGSYCPSTLFPYAREMIRSTVSKGGFPEINIAPINFDSLYLQTQEQKSGQTIH